MSTPVEAIKLFAITNQLIEHDLDQVERDHAIDLQRGYRSVADVDETYYPQIESAIRAEAAAMAPHYEVFYSLETTIRRLVRDQLQAADGDDGDDWWTERIPEDIRKEADKLQKRDIETGFTRRSNDPMDFLTFGQLSEVIKSNWDVFGALFSNIRAVERVMANLNTLRGPIAHCSPLAEDEVVRLRLTVADWFRLSD